MYNLEELCCCIDDFCQKFIPLWHQQLIENGLLKRHHEAPPSFSEVMMILILFHMSHYRDFKTFYIEHVKQYIKTDFPGLVSYTRMLTLKKRALISAKKPAVSLAVFWLCVNGKALVISPYSYLIKQGEITGRLHIFPHTP
ncbi:hypothetical protein [Xenorhabdus sp. SGI240]|uniref:hypothetical protein n=1 Tax=Xenorhabdus sp. SGI240 TaxID=3158262 RepID=UPI0032B82ED4